MPKLEVGQKLWFVREHQFRKGGSGGNECYVTKVGRKWAELNNGERIDMVTMRADGRGYSSPGKCYLSHREHKTETELRQLWTDFHRRLCHLPPDGISADDIRRAAEILKINLGAAP